MPPTKDTQDTLNSAFWFLFRFHLKKVSNRFILQNKVADIQEHFTGVEDWIQVNVCSYFSKTASFTLRFLREAVKAEFSCYFSFLTIPETDLFF